MAYDQLDESADPTFGITAPQDPRALNWFDAHAPTNTTQPAARAPYVYDPTTGRTTQAYTNPTEAGLPPTSSTQPAGAAPGPTNGAGGYPPYTGDPASYFEVLKQQLQSQGINPDQADPRAINYIVSALNAADPSGHWTTAGTDANGHTDGIMRNGQPGFKLIGGSNQWLPWGQTYAAAEGTGGFGSLGFGGGTFNGLSAADFRSSPGYEFALKQGEQAIERSAAARGTLLTGGTLKALTGYATGLADQDYGNQFQRALQTHGTQYSDLLNLATLGKPTA